MKPSTSPAGCKITVQYHQGNAFVYELESRGLDFSVRMTQGKGIERGGAWNVAVLNGRSADAISLEASAPTRAEALREVGRIWSARSVELGLPAFDWEAVAAALLAVRAL